MASVCHFLKSVSGKTERKTGDFWRALCYKSEGRSGANRNGLLTTAIVGGSKMATQRICSIGECGKKVLAKGLCSAHYHRWWRHGDPEGGNERSPNGAPEAFLRETVLPYDGDDCLIWPFTRSGRKSLHGSPGHGYAQIRRGGRMVSVQRIVCEHIHGDGTGMDSAHSCGNGHLGCVSPRHLRWATRAENMADAIAHGTHWCVAQKSA